MKLVLFVFVATFLALTLARRPRKADEKLAGYAVASLGPNYKLIRIKSMEKMIGTLYYINAKVRVRVPGGKRRENCKINVLAKYDGSLEVLRYKCR